MPGKFTEVAGLRAALLIAFGFLFGAVVGYIVPADTFDLVGTARWVVAFGVGCVCAATAAFALYGPTRRR